MTPSSVAVPVWYEPAPPPTPQPLLASETDMPDLSFDVEPLSRQEVDMSKRLAAPTRTLKSLPTRTVTFDVVRSTTPAGNLAPEHTASTPTTKLGSIVSSDSDSTDSSESETESQDDADMKIAKPTGEVIHLSKSSIGLLGKMINKLVAECLDPTRSVSGQSLHRIASAVNKFPELNQYENVWLVTDAMKQRLKYTSSKARKHAHDAVAAGKKLRSRRPRDN